MMSTSWYKSRIQFEIDRLILSLEETKEALDEQDNSIILGLNDNDYADVKNQVDVLLKKIKPMETYGRMC